MSKPLHEKNERFLIWSKGQLIGWGKEDVKNLLKKANWSKANKLKSEDRMTVAEAECFFAMEWLESFVKNGVTSEIIKKLNSRISHVRYAHVLMHSPNDLPHWRRVANADLIDDPELSMAYGVAHLLSIGAFKGLKLCGKNECEKFFIGPPNKKWCSKSCGSHFRVSLKRKKEKFRQFSQ